MSDVTWKYPEGTLVKVKGEGGTLFTISEQSYDMDNDNAPFYYLDSEYHINFDAAEEDIEFVMSAEDAGKRKLPTADDLAKNINWLDEPWEGDFSPYESEPDGDGMVTVYAETHDGLKFSYTVKIMNVEEVGF